MERFAISLDESLARELAERLTGMRLDHHDWAVAAMHSHLDHENCLEAVNLKAPATQVRQFAGALTAERGVRHGQLNPIALQAEHHHVQDDPGEEHVHYRPAR